MKLSVDARFLTTALITFSILVVAVVAVTALAGVPAAMVVAAAIGTVAVKLFDKLDYSPTFTFEAGAPHISAPWIYSVIAGILVLWGCDFFVDALQAGVQRVNGLSYCSPLYVASTVPLDWGGYIVAGWLLGKLFRDRALTVTSVGAFAFVIVALLQPSDPTRVAALISCFGIDPADDAMAGASGGMVLGIVSRGYLAVVMARIASRRGPTQVDDESPAAA
jgi:hypothetical protein